MKTIQIPTNCNPYIVVINNHVYTYKAGETAEVPDEVAEAIEDALELEPKPKRYLDKFAQLVEGSISEINESDLDGVKNISAFAFYNCDNLISIVIPNGVNSIGGYSFASCGNLAKVVLPESITNIDGRAFSESPKLTRVTLNAITPPTLTESNSIPITCFFEVNDESVAAYKVAAEWSNIANQIVAIEE